jgi:hypothetical protein
MARRPSHAAEARNRHGETEQQGKAEKQHEERQEAGPIARDQGAEVADVENQKRGDKAAARQSAGGEG